MDNYYKEEEKENKEWGRIQINKQIQREQTQKNKKKKKYKGQGKKAAGVAENQPFSSFQSEVVLAPKLALKDSTRQKQNLATASTNFFIFFPLLEVETYVFLI